MHYFPYDVKLRLLAHSRSFLANQKARNAIVGAENLLKLDVECYKVGCCGLTLDVEGYKHECCVMLSWMLRTKDRL